MAFGGRRSQKLTVLFISENHSPILFKRQVENGFETAESVQKVIIKGVNPVQFDSNITLIWYHK